MLNLTYVLPVFKNEFSQKVIISDWTALNCVASVMMPLLRVWSEKHDQVSPKAGQLCRFLHEIAGELESGDIEKSRLPFRPVAFFMQCAVERSLPGSFHGAEITCGEEEQEQEIESGAREQECDQRILDMALLLLMATQRWMFSIDFAVCITIISYEKHII
jgi:hypothetical protein